MTRRLSAFVIATAVVALTAAPSDAARQTADFKYDQHAVGAPANYQVAKTRAKVQHVTIKKSRKAWHVAQRKAPSPRVVRVTTTRTVHHGVAARVAAQVVAHPAGCPARRFCGCGTAKYFGLGTPRAGGLALAANWLRFPRAAPGPGMAAARRGHVFAIIRYLGGNRVLAYDPNSGRGRTRIHVRSLAGYTVVNPRGSKYAAAG